MVRNKNQTVSPRNKECIYRNVGLRGLALLSRSKMPVKKAKNTTSSAGKKSKKKNTREKVLKAARKVFAEHPYHAASIRMIGTKGRIDHPLVSYYFPSKAKLFETIVVEACEEYYQANISWFEGLEKVSPSEGMARYLDRLIDFSRKNPEPMRIIALNMVQKEKAAIIPGIKIIEDLFSRASQVFKEEARLNSPPEQLEMFIQNFNAAIISYMGAGTFHANILGLKPGSSEYYKWVKEAMTFMFLPHLELMTSRPKKK